MDDVDRIEELYARGVTDGLPVVPPTLERVQAAIQASGRRRDELVALVAPQLGRASPTTFTSSWPAVPLVASRPGSPAGRFGMPHHGW